MKKIIKKWGASIVIRFTPEEAKIFNLKEGDILEIDDKLFKRRLKKIKNGRKKI